MPLKSLSTPSFRAPRQAEVSWNTWRKGLNTLLRESEIDKAEAVSLTNLMLAGSGVPTKRWGSANYFLAGATGYGRFLFPAKNPADDTWHVLSMTDWGILTKLNNASYTTLLGASWASGYNLEAAQLGGNVYLVQSQREMVRYNFSSLTGFPTLSIPGTLTATNLSNASGLTTWSWRVTATSKVGETVGSTALSLASLPEQLSKTVVRLTWAAVSAASGDITGYNVYRGNSGAETWIGGVNNSSTSFNDFGAVSPDATRLVPTADTTGGVMGKYIISFQDRLIIAGIPGAPSKVFVSGRYPQQERFDWQAGGGSILIEPDSGDNITGLATYFNSTSQTQTIIVFKENSIWEVRLTTITFGNSIILDPSYRLLTHSHGCSSHRSIKAVENDIIFSNRRGCFMLRYEPNLLNVLSAAELSAKIRPFFEGLTETDLTTAAAEYVDKKYILSFPASKKSIVFDRERLAFTGPWNTSFGIKQWGRYVDTSGIERKIAIDSDDSYVTEFSKNYIDDKGTAFNTIFKSRKEDFGDWTLFKTINELYTLFRNVQGQLSANIYLEERSGVTITAKSFTVTGNTGKSGFGINEFGLIKFGLSSSSGSISSDELPKNTLLYKTARTFQVEIKTTNRIDNYELLAIKALAIPQARSAPVGWRTS